VVNKEQKKKENVFSAVNEYLKDKTDEKFIPGKTWVRYAGRVFDNNEFINLIDATLDGWITGGRFEEEFEYELSKYLNVHASILVNSGSSANLIAVSSLNSYLLNDKRMRKGDEIVTVASGFPTTVNPIIQNGFIPVFVDIEEATYNANPELIEDAISDRTRAIILAHTLGNPFDIDKISKIAKDNNLFLIEDNCDALGSEYGDRKTGTFGDFSTQSFYPAHHITTGEGGAVSTNDYTLERIARSYRDWGRDCYCKTGEDNACGVRFGQKFGDLPFGYDHKFVYSHIGYNLKMTDLQAAIGVAQMKKIENFTRKRRDNFEYLYSRLKEYESYFILPKSLQKSKPSWFSFPLTVDEKAGFTRNEIVKYLEDRKIMTRPIFAGNLVRHPAYLEVEKRIASELTVTDRVMNNSFFIGVYPGINEEMREYVCDVFDEFMRAHK